MQGQRNMRTMRLPGIVTTRPGVVNEAIGL
jgi:hypothetical protein